MLFDFGLLHFSVKRDFLTHNMTLAYAVESYKFRKSCT